MMGLVKCRSCENLFGSKAGKCPNCGLPAEKRNALWYVGVAAVVLIMGGVAVVGFQREGALRKPQVAKKIETPVNRAVEADYKRLVALYRAQKFEEAEKALDNFRKHGKLGHKDVARVERGLEIHRLVEKAKLIPAGEAETNLTLYKRLLLLDPDNETYRRKVARYSLALKRKQRGQKRKAEEDRLQAKRSREKAPFLLEAPF